MKPVDNFLNGITMYRLVFYGLICLSVISIIFSFFGFVSYSPLSLIYSVLFLVGVCYISNIFFAKFFKVQTNTESAWITALILFFIVFPLESISDLKTIALVGVLAMASKYLLAIKKKHIFNPAAISIFLLGLFGSGIASWWVGTPAMLIPTAILGFLILKKVKRFELFFTFLFVSLISTLIFNYSNYSFYEILKSVFLSGPLIFFGTIMLTEPLTTPPTKELQVIYGAIVGALFGAQFSFGPIYSTPALALIIGNLFSYIVSPRERLVLTLVAKSKLSKDIYEFAWGSSDKLKFKAGQYLEWTLGHKRPDMRGNRRFFTISSSPAEENLKIGVKFYENSSSWKKKLISLEVGDKIIASQLSGEFTLSDDPKEKLVFIAGGIGVTPFRSMIKNLLDKKESRDIILLFSNKTPTDIVYKDIFDEAEKIVGLKTIYFVGDLAGEPSGDNFRVGIINEETIKKEILDYKERKFYISGSHSMVSSFKNALKKTGIKRSKIKIDFFHGYV